MLQVGIFIKIYIKATASVKVNQDTVSGIWKAFSYKTEYLRLKSVSTAAFYRQH